MFEQLKKENVRHDKRDSCTENRSCQINLVFFECGKNCFRKGVLPLMGELVNIRTGVNLRPKSANRAFRCTKQGISSSGREMMLFP